MKLAIIQLPDDWERGYCIDCLFSDENGECCIDMSPSSNEGCGLIVDEGDRDKGPLTAYSRNKITELLQQNLEDQFRIAKKIADAARRKT